MGNIKLVFSHNDLFTIVLTCWRIMLAILGNYIVVSLFSALIPNLLSLLFYVDKATVLLWMMLLSFLFYSLLVLWVISSKKLLKTSLQLLVISVALFSALQWVTPASTPTELKELKP